MCFYIFLLALARVTDRQRFDGLIWVLMFMQLRRGRCAQLELSSTDEVTWDHMPPVTSAQVQPSPDFICLCLLIDRQSVMVIL